MADIYPFRSPRWGRILLLVLLSLCVTPAWAQPDSIIYDLTLVGDAGTLLSSKLDSILKSTRHAGVPSSAIYLGDNIYPHGLPGPGHAGRKEAEQILLQQVSMVSDFDNIYFIPGNHDWKNGKHEGLQYVINQRLFFDSLKRSDVHFPLKDGCPGPEEIHLTNDLILVLMDTQWFLHPWDKPEGDKSPCDVKTAADVTIHLDDILNRNQGKRIIVAGHHPVFTYGNHGGVFEARDHLFPFTALQKDLYIPLPVVGSLYPMYRKIFGDVQDVAHPLNKAMRRGLHDIMKQYPGTMYVSGHEHALQHIEADSLHYVVSGSAAKSTYARKKELATFVSSENGFAKLLVMKSGQVKVEYYSTKRLLYSTNLPALTRVHEELVRSSSLDTLWVTSQASHKYHASSWEKTMLGENYRTEWETSISLRAFDIGMEQGGLQIIKRGGGMETMSLRLHDSTGRSFSLRTVEKFPTRALRPALQKTFIQSVVQDQVSAEHPFGALAVAPLADLAGVYHTNPRLVYAPSDTRWGTYRKDFSGQMMLFEERPEGAGDQMPFFGNPEKMISTHKLLELLKNDHDVQIDQHMVLRSRLFDMWIGDWDRHDDQWRWGLTHHGKSKVYQPIPIDRDQAFFLNEGFVPHQWRKKQFKPYLEGFGKEIRWVPGLMEVGRWFDGTFLNSMTQRDFVEAARRFQQISDLQIDSAVHHLPHEVYGLHGLQISESLKARRSILVDNAAAYYKFLAKTVDIAGSDEREWFEANWQIDGDLHLKMFKRSKEGAQGKLLYEREFLKSETKEVRLYGLAGDDMFRMTGTSPAGIKLRIVGGEGMDEMVNEARGASNTYVYDLRGDLKVQGRFHDRTSDDPEVNRYERKALEYNKFIPKNSITYNIDDGIYLSAGFSTIVHGFRKKPYKSHHFLQVRYAVRTYSYSTRYEGRFPSLLGKWDLELDGDLRSPNFVVNFFGWGNESAFDQAIHNQPGLDINQAIDYYRLRFRDLRVEVKVNHKVGTWGYFKAGPTFQRGEVVDPGPYHYVTDYNATLDQSILAIPKSFAGLTYTVGVDKRDNPRFTTRGIIFKQTSKWMHGIETSGFSAYTASLTLYQSFRLPALMTYVFNASGGHNIGSYQLFQSQTLDGNTEIRGYRETRFYGDTKVFFNNEIRMKLGTLHTYLFPAAFGIHLFYDVGRVWYKDGNGVDPSTVSGKSADWHPSYGGGVWLKPYDLTTLVAEVGHSRESTLVYLRLGFLF